MKNLKKPVSFLLAVVIFFSGSAFTLEVMAGNEEDLYGYDFDIREEAFEVEYVEKEFDYYMFEYYSRIGEEISRIVNENWDEGFIESIVFSLKTETVIVDGDQMRIESYAIPIISHNEILLPLEPIVEAIGINLQDALRSLQGEHVGMVPIISEGNVMISLSSLEANLGFEYYLNLEEQQVILTRNFQTRRLVVKSHREIDIQDLGVIDSARSIDENINILQFRTINEAKEAYRYLSSLTDV